MKREDVEKWEDQNDESWFMDGPGGELWEANVDVRKLTVQKFLNKTGIQLNSSHDCWDILDGYVDENIFNNFTDCYTDAITELNLVI